MDNIVGLNPQVITTKEARKLLTRETSEELSNVEVEDIINQLDFLATLFVTDYKQNNYKEN